MAALAAGLVLQVGAERQDRHIFGKVVVPLDGDVDGGAHGTVEEADGVDGPVVGDAGGHDEGAAVGVR